jgi:NAD(P)-dependent dehydrogenase (short-subunit alcohol dehydrogenase family)
MNWSKFTIYSQLHCSLEMDVNSKDSIRDAVKAIAEVDGKLDALVNKYVPSLNNDSPYPYHFAFYADSAGAVGTIRAFWANPASPERKDPFTLGTSLFEADSFSEWDSVFNANTASIYFMTLAFSELLQKGSNARADYSASVINITSCVGSSKLSSGFVRRFPILALCYPLIRSSLGTKIPYAITKGAANHLTKLLAADFARRNMRVRVNAVAPGVFITEMSKPWMKNEENMTKEEATMISGSLLPLPAERAGM